MFTWNRRNDASSLPLAHIHDGPVCRQQSSYRLRGSTQIALKEKGWSPKPIDVICFTHYHADHISGLPGLLLTMGNAERTEPLTLIGQRDWNVW